MTAYHRILILSSLQDIAGSAMHALLEQDFDARAGEGGLRWLTEETKRRNGVPSAVDAALASCAEDIIHAPMALVEEHGFDFVLFASRHSSYKHEKTLTCHAIGNFFERDYSPF